MNHAEHKEECVPEFRGEIHCKVHGRKAFPTGFYEDRDSIGYSCGRMSELTVPVDDIPDDSLTYIYRKLKKTNHSIVRDGGNRRFESLISRLSEEIKKRGLEIPNTSLTNRVIMNKRQAMESDVPVIIKTDVGLVSMISEPSPKN